MKLWFSYDVNGKEARIFEEGLRHDIYGDIPCSQYTNFQFCGDYSDGEGLDNHNLIIPSKVIGTQYTTCDPWEYLDHLEAPDPDELGHSEYRVTEIGDEAFEHNCKIHHLVLPGSLKKIGYHAFADCQNLRTVHFGKGIKKIGNGAFEGCHHLTAVVIPSSVKTISDDAFKGCKIYVIYNFSTLPLKKGSEDFGCIAKYAKKIITDPKEDSGLLFADDYATLKIGSSKILIPLSHENDKDENMFDGGYNDLEEECREDYEEDNEDEDDEDVFDEDDEVDEDDEGDEEDEEIVERDMNIAAGQAGIMPFSSVPYTDEGIADQKVEQKEKKAGNTKASSAEIPVEMKVSGKQRKALSAVSDLLSENNYAGAEAACDRILKSDDSNSQAWVLKGWAIAGQAKFDDTRYDEICTCFLKANNELPEGPDKSSQLADYFTSFTSIVNKLAEVFLNYLLSLGLSDEVIRAIPVFHDMYLKGFRVVCKEYGFSEEEKAVKENVFHAVYLHNLLEAVTQSWFGEVKIYNNTDNPTRDDCLRVVQNGDNLIKLLKDLGEKNFRDDTSFEDKINLYERIVSIHLNLCKVRIHQMVYDEIQGYHYKSYQFLANSAIEIRQKIANEYQVKVNETKQEETNKRIAAYWENHKEEKMAIERSISDIEKKVEDMRAKLQHFSHETELLECRKKIVSLEHSKKELGLFKFKEKKAIQEQIEELKNQLTLFVREQNKEKEELQIEIDKLQCQKVNLRAALTADRPSSEKE